LDCEKQKYFVGPRLDLTPQVKQENERGGCQNYHGDQREDSVTSGAFSVTNQR